MLTEFDYKLLDAISKQPITLLDLLKNYGDASVTRCRYDRLLTAGLVLEQQGLLILTPLGKVELADYHQRSSTEKALEERAHTALYCSVASAVAAVASAFCALLALFK